MTDNRRQPELQLAEESLIAGRDVTCEVVVAEADGYSVLLPKENVPGFLPTKWRLRTGERLIAQFDRFENGRAMLSAKIVNHPIMSSWFTSWADLSRLIRKRATDLIPTVAERGAYVLKAEGVSFNKILADLQDEHRTGALLVSTGKRNSRSGAILWRGLVVGCIYCSVDTPDPKPTQEALALFVGDLQSGESVCYFHELPEVIVLPFAALFCDNATTEGKDFDSMLREVTENKQTACLAVSLNNGGTYLAFVYKGQYTRAFDVEAQNYIEDLDQLHRAIARGQLIRIGSSVLPEDFFQEPRRYTYWLSDYARR